MYVFSILTIINNIILSLGLILSYVNFPSDTDITIRILPCNMPTAKAISFKKMDLTKQIFLVRGFIITLPYI